jgi:hypothetical protein
VSALFTRAAASVFVEITEHAAHLSNDSRNIDLVIERDATGVITRTSVEAIQNALKTLATPGQQAFCLLPARGVSVRRISLPASDADEIERLLPLQIDAHFPIAADELAWGYTVLGASAPPLKELLVAAVKKDSVRQYAQIFSEAGFKPLFVIAALARQGICATVPAKFGLLEVGRNRSELLTLDESGPATLRVISLGGDGDFSTEPLLAALRNNGSVEKIYVSGKGAALWSARIAANIPSEPVEVTAGQSTAIAGIRETLRRGREPLLIHDSREAVAVERAPAHWKWPVIAAILLVVSFGLRYAEPILRRAKVTQAIADLRAAKENLPKVDREVGFLSYIKTNQPTYLEVINALANAAPPGTKIDSFSMSRRGEVSLRGSAQGGPMAGTLRSKMIESGFFSSVVLDEQTPNQQNQQQVSFRMTAQLRPEGERKAAPAKVASTNAPKSSLTNAPKSSATNAPKNQVEVKHD